MRQDQLYEVRFYENRRRKGYNGYPLVQVCRGTLALCYRLSKNDVREPGRGGAVVIRRADGKTVWPTEAIDGGAAEKGNAR